MCFLWLGLKSLEGKIKGRQANGQANWKTGGEKRESRGWKQERGWGGWPKVRHPLLFWWAPEKGNGGSYGPILLVVRKAFCLRGRAKLRRSLHPVQGREGHRLSLCLGWWGTARRLPSCCRTRRKQCTWGIRATARLAREAGTWRAAARGSATLGVGADPDPRSPRGEPGRI